jgi:hypothetical protein
MPLDGRATITPTTQIDFVRRWLRHELHRADLRTNGFYSGGCILEL